MSGAAVQTVTRSDDIFWHYCRCVSGRLVERENANFTRGRWQTRSAGGTRHRAGPAMEDASNEKKILRLETKVRTVMMDMLGWGEWCLLYVILLWRHTFLLLTLSVTYALFSLSRRFSLRESVGFVLKKKKNKQGQRVSRCGYSKRMAQRCKGKTCQRLRRASWRSPD